MKHLLTCFPAQGQRQPPQSFLMTKTRVNMLPRAHTHTIQSMWYTHRHQTTAAGDYLSHSDLWPALSCCWSLVLIVYNPSRRSRKWYDQASLISLNTGLTSNGILWGVDIWTNIECPYIYIYIYMVAHIWPQALSLTHVLLQFDGGVFFFIFCHFCNSGSIKKIHFAMLKLWSNLITKLHILVLFCF